MSTASNPQIAVITYMEKRIIESQSNNNHMLAMRQMVTLCNIMKVSHRPTELMDEIHKEYTVLLGDTVEGRAEYTRDNWKKYSDWLGDIMSILYTNGYLVDKGYGMVYPSDLPKEGGYQSPFLTNPPTP